MKLAGLQKLTLLDYPGQLACTVFTRGCNLRCPFCQNADLVLPERFDPAGELPEETFFSFLETRKGKLSAVAVSGGEPTMHGDLPQFLRRIREMGFLVKLDTNGTNPGMLGNILENGLADYVAMDIKNTPEKYLLTCGLEGTRTDICAQVQQSIDMLRSGTVPCEFRTTVVDGLHTQEDIVSMAKWLQGAPAWYLQQFMPGPNLVGFGDDGSQLRSPSPETLTQMCEAARRYMPAAETRGI